MNVDLRPVSAQLRRELASRAEHWALIGVSLDGAISGDALREPERLRAVVEAFWCGLERVPDDWWRTPLGALCASAYEGQDLGGVTHQKAADILGVHIGTVGQLVHRGTLPKNPRGSVDLCAVLQRVYRQFWTPPPEPREKPVYGPPEPRMEHLELARHYEELAKLEAEAEARFAAMEADPILGAPLI